MENTVLMWVGVLGLLITIIGGFGYIVRVIFRQAQALLVAPILARIDLLSISLDRLKEVLDRLQNESSLQRERIAKVEQSSKAAHHRIDFLANNLKIKIPAERGSGQ